MTTISTVAEVTIELASEAATQALAAEVARRARAGDVIALRGELGSGKTSFARGFIRALGRGDEEVPSPTFTLVEQYDLDRLQVWHFDLYRLAKPEDAYELGLEEALAGGVLLIEWPERLGPLLPRERLDVTLSAGSSPSRRRAVLRGSPRWAERLGEIGRA